MVAGSNGVETSLAEGSSCYTSSPFNASLITSSYRFNIPVPETSLLVYLPRRPMTLDQPHRLHDPPPTDPVPPISSAMPQLIAARKPEVLKPLAAIESSKRLAAYTAVDHHIKSEHRVRGVFLSLEPGTI